MVLVFYGHFIEELMLLKNPTAAAHYKFIYSFHMVLFVVLAGYVAKDNEVAWPVGKFIKHLFFSRLLPFLFFTLLMMVPPVFFDGKFYGLALPSVAGYTQGVLNSIFGLPSFCIPSWFLLLIIGLELLHYGVYRYLRNADIKIITAAFAFYVAGYLFNLKFDIFNPLKGRTVGWNYFFIHEAVTLYAFYLAGFYLRRKHVFMDRISFKILVPGTVIFFLTVLLTYPLNKGAFTFKYYDAVVIMLSSHGHMLLFPLTALAGCALTLFLAEIIPAPKLLAWMGQHALLLMCLNGIFYHYINPPAAKWAMVNLPDTGGWIFVVGTLVTVVSMALCLPLVYVFSRYVPQLVGKPKRNGPLLRNFV